jgi:hypothetical protein
MTRSEDLVAAIRAEAAGKGFLTAGASREKLDTLERELRVTLPADLRELLLLSDGIGVARATGAYLESVAGLRRLAMDDLFDRDFPGALAVGDDGANGTYLVDVQGRCGNPGDVLLTDRGSLLPRDTVRAGRTVSDMLDAVIGGEDLWARPRLGE